MELCFAASQQMHRDSGTVRLHQQQALAGRLACALVGVPEVQLWARLPTHTAECICVRCARISCGSLMWQAGSPHYVPACASRMESGVGRGLRRGKLSSASARSSRGLSCLTQFERMKMNGSECRVTFFNFTCDFVYLTCVRSSVCTAMSGPVCPSGARVESERRVDFRLPREQK